MQEAEDAGYHVPVPDMARELAVSVLPGPAIVGPLGAAVVMLTAPTATNTTVANTWMPTIRANRSYTPFTQVFKSPPNAARAASRFSSMSERRTLPE